MNKNPFYRIFCQQSRRRGLFNIINMLVLNAAAAMLHIWHLLHMQFYFYPNTLVWWKSIDYNTQHQIFEFMHVNGLNIILNILLVFCQYWQKSLWQKRKKNEQRFGIVRDTIAIVSNFFFFFRCISITRSDGGIHQSIFYQMQAIYA